MIWTKLGLSNLHFEKLKDLHLTKRHYIIAGSAVLLAAVLAVGATTLSSRTSSAAADSVMVPERTPIHVTLDQTVASNEKPGHHFQATLSEPVMIDGQTVIPKGARAEGVIVEAKRAGYFKGHASLQLALQNVNVDGQNHAIRTWSPREVAKDHKTRNLLLWGGGGAGGGVLIGALAGGGTGAAIGGPVGAAAGTTVALVTAKRDIKLRPETRLTFKLAKPATFNVKS